MSWHRLGPEPENWRSEWDDLSDCAGLLYATAAGDEIVPPELLPSVPPPDEDVDKRVDREILKSVMAEFLGILPERRGEILRLRFGIGCEPCTQEQVGARMNMSKANVSRIEALAIRTLRHPRNSRQLRRFL